MRCIHPEHPVHPVKKLRFSPEPAVESDRSATVLKASRSRVSCNQQYGYTARVAFPRSLRLVCDTAAVRKYPGYATQTFTSSESHPIHPVYPVVLRGSSEVFVV
jgi:hypothetical protein